MEIRVCDSRSRSAGLLAKALLTVAAATPLFGQSPAEFREILNRLDKLEKQNRALTEEVQALRSELASVGRDRDSQQRNEDRLAVQESRIEEQAQTKVESSQRLPLRITGMALFNTFLNSDRSGGAQYSTVAVPGYQGSGGATFRQTILGLEYHGAPTLWGGTVHGSVAMDFFGGSGAVLDQTVRLRTASIGLDWRTRSVLAGLDKPIFAPREPASLAQVGISPLTGAGNLWLWVPQVRFEQDFGLGQLIGVRAQIGAVQTRESSLPATDPYAGSVERSRPGLEGRIEFRHGSEDRRIEMAPGFHTSTSHVAGTSVPSSLFSLDWLARPFSAVELTGAFFTGQNVVPLGTGGIRQGLVVLAPGIARPIHSRGGWSQLTLNVTPRLSFHLFSGQQDDRNSEVPRGGIGKNLLFGGNFFYRLSTNVIVSLETSQVRTAYVGGSALLNNHYDLAVAYLF